MNLSLQSQDGAYVWPCVWCHPRAGSMPSQSAFLQERGELVAKKLAMKIGKVVM